MRRDPGIVPEEFHPKRSCESHRLVVMGHIQTEKLGSSNTNFCKSDASPNCTNRLIYCELEPLGQSPGASKSHCHFQIPPSQNQRHELRRPTISTSPGSLYSLCQKARIFGFFCTMSSNTKLRATGYSRLDGVIDLASHVDLTGYINHGGILRFLIEVSRCFNVKKLHMCAMLMKVPLSNTCK